MARSTNALAELAERLSPRGETKTLILVNAKDILKAKRIVAELAKVGFNEMGPDAPASFIALMNCRAIAEEGVNNEQ